jgi:CTP:molybdopterin cytidylyltransferase MocA
MALPWRVLSAVILAAGDSSRMGAPKAALLTPDGDSFVARIVRTLREAHVHDLVIVTGRHHDEVIDAPDARSSDAVASHRSQSRSITRPVVVTARRHGCRGDSPH